MRKTTLFTILFTILLIPCADAKLPFIVQTVYFKPTDAPPAPKTLGQTMHDVQMLYLEEMERNGYGEKTFRLERNAAGDPIIHTVNGRHATAHYRATTYESIKAELPQRLLNQNNITVIIAGGVRLIDNRVWGVGFPVYGHACGGKAVIAAENANFGVPLIAHELGHGFGLYHNIIGDPSLMGRGRDNIDNVIEFNDYETRWLDKHHYFNDVHAIDHIPNSCIPTASEKPNPTLSAFGLILSRSVNCTKHKSFGIPMLRLSAGRGSKGITRQRSSLLGVLYSETKTRLVCR